MATLTLTFGGPLQSWGAGSRNFYYRDTATTPTKSATIGLIAGALGLDRDDQEGVRPIAAARFGVRVDREGEPLSDLQTASIIDRESNKLHSKMSYRYYLQDASFVVGLESELVNVEAWASAMRRPYYAPSLGRRGCVPGGPIGIAVSKQGLEQALASHPFTGNLRGADEELSMLVEPRPGDRRRGTLVLDQVVSFTSNRREYRQRNSVQMSVANPDIERTDATEHSPFSMLEETS